MQEGSTSTAHERSVTWIRSLQNPGRGGFDDSGGLPDILNTKICRGYFRTGLRSSGSRHYFKRCGSTFDTNCHWEPPTCPRRGMNKMNPVTTAVMNLTQSFLEVFRSFGTALRADIASVQSDQQLTFYHQLYSSNLKRSPCACYSFRTHLL